MHLRRVTASDREVYLKMVHDFYHSPAVLHPVPDEHFQRTFEEILRSDVYSDGFLLEDDEGRCMGYAVTAKGFSQECGGQFVWVDELYVLPEHQGKGVGTEALRLLEEYYPHCKRFRLEVEPDNEDAARLYRRLGFEGLAYRQFVKDKF